MKRLILCLILIPIAAFAGALDDKSPAYFVQRYGAPKSVKNVASISVHHPKRGSVEVKGQFSVRQFQSDDLTVRVVFYLPSLQTASVRLQLPRKWSEEQVRAALTAYGGSWEPVRTAGFVDSWIAPDGTVATNMLTWVDIQSKAIVDEAAKTLSNIDAKKKAVPKF